MGHEVLFLADKDVRDMLSMSRVMQVVEERFARQADPESAILGSPLAYSTDDKKLGFKWRLKTAIIRDVPVAGVRIAGYKIDADGVGSGGEPESTRYIMLSDPETGSPLAIIDEHWSFALRTTAAACIAAKYLARKDSRVVGIIGVGNMGKTSLMGLAELFDIEEVRATSRRPESRRAYALSMSEALGLPVEAKDSYEEVCRGADIIITGTPAVSPFVKYEWLKEGVFVAGVGHEEMEPGVYAGCDRIFVDYDRRVEAHPAHIKRVIDEGVIREEDISGEIWEVVCGKKPSRQNDREKILVLTVGLTVHDIAIAHCLFEQAKAEGRGQRLPFA